MYRYLFTDGNACVYTCRACCTLIQLFNRALSMVTKSALPFFKHTARASIQGILVGMYIYFLLPYLFHPEAELTSHGNDVKTTVPSSAAAATTLQSILPACILDRIVRKCVQRESMTTCNKSRAGAKKICGHWNFKKEESRLVSLYLKDVISPPRRRCSRGAAFAHAATHICTW